MHIVLTHEQADFDAVASLLAVSILDPEAIPVLPRRVNRNVRAYITLYGDGLPFLDFGDLERSPIQRITLVDSQSLITLRGVSEDTEVHVVDHHPKDEELDPTWTAHLELMGATTTLLIEDIQELGLELDFIQATMLLLGIYEDTGSLTYSSTTPRDVRACAWLLERGANLNIASDFLNHPLSEAQNALYDRLLESASTYEFQGLSVVIAMAEAEGFMEEVSTLAHKLRDLFDPDGIFVLVNLNGHIQMVARSTTDSLDVSRLATHFGGGGHDRASAALIRRRSLEEIREELLKLLPGVIQPEMTVGEIMSRGPQLLSPEVTVAEAAEQMRRFGHEGYPVVKGGKVIGLLTRRAVDRAMAHGMEALAISSVMNAGRLVVRPDDSVQHLQRVMIDHDWGQVPVVEPKTGEIIGIVTRTDLIKTLVKTESQASKASIPDKLERALPPAKLRLLKLIARQAEKQGAVLYIVGGFVRDLLLGAPSADFDLVVEGDAIGLAEALSADYGGKISSHRRFGTAKWHLDVFDQVLKKALDLNGIDPEQLPKTLDLVSARTEFYRHPTALPSVQRGSIKLDLHRRDFSINTLAIRLDGRHYGELLDHWGGGRDLHDRQIRVLHSLSFVDDPTRMLRAVRLEQRLGFLIEPRTLELLEEALPMLIRVSGERIHSELIQIFQEPRLSEIMSRLQELDLLEAIHPSLSWNQWMEDSFQRSKEFEAAEAWGLARQPREESLYYALWFSQLSEEEAESVCVKLHLPTDVKKCILETNRLMKELPELCLEGQPSTFVAVMQGLQEDALVATWLGLHEHPKCRKAIDQFLSQWRSVSPYATGDTLRELGLPPGPAYGRIIDALRKAWLDGRVNSAEEEDRLLGKLVAEEKGD